MATPKTSSALERVTLSVDLVEAKLTPQDELGMEVGFTQGRIKANAVVENGLFHRAGMLAEDVIISVNGVELDDNVASVRPAVEKDAKKLTMVVLRDKSKAKENESKLVKANIGVSMSMSFGMPRCLACLHCNKPVVEDEGLVRFHCVECDMTDWCADCFKKGKHLTHTHYRNASSFNKPMMIVKEMMGPEMLRQQIRGDTVSASLHNALVTFAGRPLFGSLARLPVEYLGDATVGSGDAKDSSDSQEGRLEYRFVSYRQVHRTSLLMACGFRSLLERLGLRGHGLSLHEVRLSGGVAGTEGTRDTQSSSQPGAFHVGIMGKNRMRWVTTDFMCALNQFVVVGLHSTWPAEELSYVLDESDCAAVCCDGALLDKCLSALSRIRARNRKSLNGHNAREATQDGSGTQQDKNTGRQPEMNGGGGKIQLVVALDAFGKPSDIKSKLHGKGIDVSQQFYGEPTEGKQTGSFGSGGVQKRRLVLWWIPELQVYITDFPSLLDPASHDHDYTPAQQQGAFHMPALPAGCRTVSTFGQANVGVKPFESRSVIYGALHTTSSGSQQELQVFAGANPDEKRSAEQQEQKCSVIQQLITERKQKTEQEGRSKCLLCKRSYCVKDGIYGLRYNLGAVSKDSSTNGKLNDVSLYNEANQDREVRVKVLGPIGACHRCFKERFLSAAREAPSSMPSTLPDTLQKQMGVTAYEDGAALTEAVDLLSGLLREGLHSAIRVSLQGAEPIVYQAARDHPRCQRNRKTESQSLTDTRPGQKSESNSVSTALSSDVSGSPTSGAAGVTAEFTLSDYYGLVYTSGSSGPPKGCIVTDSSWNMSVAAQINTASPQCVYAYNHLGHAMDRMLIYQTLCNGGRVCFKSYLPLPARKSCLEKDRESKSSTSRAPSIPKETAFKLVRSLEFYHSHVLGAATLTKFAFQQWHAVLCEAVEDALVPLLPENPIDGLLRDMQVAHPTLVMGMPDFWTHLYRKRNTLLALLCKLMRQVPQVVHGGGRHGDGCGVDYMTVCTLADAVARRWLGDRLHIIGTGGAKTSTSVHHWMSYGLGNYKLWTPTAMLQVAGETDKEATSGGAGVQSNPGADSDGQSGGGSGSGAVCDVEEWVDERESYRHAGLGGVARKRYLHPKWDPWRAQAFCINAYGTTEASGLTNNGSVLPRVSVELREVNRGFKDRRNSCDEHKDESSAAKRERVRNYGTGYLLSDIPYSRGEICVHTDSMIAGYYKKPDKTKGAFLWKDRKKWSTTGDIGILEPSGCIHIVDRVSGLVELYVDSRSAYFSPEEVESRVVNGCQSTHDTHISEAGDLFSYAFATGERTMPHVVCVCAVRSSGVQRWCQRFVRSHTDCPLAKMSPDKWTSYLQASQATDESDEPSLLSPEGASTGVNVGMAFYNYCLQEARRVCSDIDSWKAPSGLVLTFEPFSCDSSPPLLTSTGKLKRPNIYNYFVDRIDRRLGLCDDAPPLPPVLVATISRARNPVPGGSPAASPPNVDRPSKTKQVPSLSSQSDGGDAGGGKDVGASPDEASNQELQPPIEITVHPSTSAPESGTGDLSVVVREPVADLQDFSHEVQELLRLISGRIDGRTPARPSKTTDVFGSTAQHSSPQGQASLEEREAATRAAQSLVAQATRPVLHLCLQAAYTAFQKAAVGDGGDVKVDGASGTGGSSDGVVGASKTDAGVVDSAAQCAEDGLVLWDWDWVLSDAMRRFYDLRGGLEVWIHLAGNADGGGSLPPVEWMAEATVEHVLEALLSVDFTKAGEVTGESTTNTNLQQLSMGGGWSGLCPGVYGLPVNMSSVGMNLSELRGEVGRDKQRSIRAIRDKSAPSTPPCSAKRTCQSGCGVGGCSDAVSTCGPVISTGEYWNNVMSQVHCHPDNAHGNTLVAIDLDVSRDLWQFQCRQRGEPEPNLDAPTGPEGVSGAVLVVAGGAGALTVVTLLSHMLQALDSSDCSHVLCLLEASAAGGSSLDRQTPNQQRLLQRLCARADRIARSEGDALDTHVRQRLQSAVTPGTCEVGASGDDSRRTGSDASAGSTIPRLLFLCGSALAPQFALPADCYAHLLANTRHLIHCGGPGEFALGFPYALCRAFAVVGAHRLLDFAQAQLKMRQRCGACGNGDSTDEGKDGSSGVGVGGVGGGDDGKSSEDRWPLLRVTYLSHSQSLQGKAPQERQSLYDVPNGPLLVKGGFEGMAVGSDARRAGWIGRATGFGQAMWAAERVVSQLVVPRAESRRVCFSDHGLEGGGRSDGGNGGEYQQCGRLAVVRRGLWRPEGLLWSLPEHTPTVWHGNLLQRIVWAMQIAGCSMDTPALQVGSATDPYGGAGCFLPTSKRSVVTGLLALMAKTPWDVLSGFRSAWEELVMLGAGINSRAPPCSQNSMTRQGVLLVHACDGFTTEDDWHTDGQQTGKWRAVLSDKWRYTLRWSDLRALAEYQALPSATPGPRQRTVKLSSAVGSEQNVLDNLGRQARLHAAYMHPNAYDAALGTDTGHVLCCSTSSAKCSDERPEASSSDVINSGGWQSRLTEVVLTVQHFHLAQLAKLRRNAPGCGAAEAKGEGNCDSKSPEGKVTTGSDKVRSVSYAHFLELCLRPEWSPLRSHLLYFESALRMGYGVLSSGCEMPVLKQDFSAALARFLVCCADAGSDVSADSVQSSILGEKDVMKWPEATDEVNALKVCAKAGRDALLASEK